MFQMSCAWVLGCFDGGDGRMGGSGKGRQGKAREGKARQGGGGETADGGWRPQKLGWEGEGRELGAGRESGQRWPTVASSGQ